MPVSPGTSKQQRGISTLGRALVPEHKRELIYNGFKKEKSEVGSSSFWIFSHLSCYIPCQLLTGGRGIIVAASSQLVHVVWTRTGLRAAMITGGQSLPAGQKGSVLSGD